MIIGGSKVEVIENIKRAIQRNELNTKVEIGDPNLTSKQKQEIITRYLANQDKFSYKMKNHLARFIIDMVMNIQNKETEIIGIENIQNIKTGAIITSNHFNPLDSTVVQKAMKKVIKYF